jgi:putative ABC transport system permease protein
MRPAALWFMYRNRLRAQLGEELLAVFGIAVGVALVFAVLVANQSISGSVSNLLRGIVGRASLELHARDARGFDQDLYNRVERIPAVRSAAPALVRRVVIVGPDGRRSVTLFGGGRGLQQLGGALIQRVGAVDVPAVSLPESVARPLGVHPGQRLTVVSGERRVTARVGALLSGEDIGALARSPIVLAPLAYAQHLTGLYGRVTHILVEPRAGAADDAKRALERLAAGKLDVRPSDSEAVLMREAAKSNDQSSLLFSAISAGIGLLFAYNAMLLTLPTRRRICAEMRLIGFRRSQVLGSLLFETALLAVVGVGVGLVLGEVLSRVLFGEIPRYLASAFAIGSERIVSPATVAVACAVGIVAALAAAARPLRELYAVNPMDATHRLTLTQGERIVGGRPQLFFWAGLGILGAVTVIALVVPSASLVAATLCALVSVAVLPLVLSLLVRLVSAVTLRGHRRAMAWVVVKEIAATPTRAAALAATAAVAVFGITTVEGARRDLIRGADVFAHELAAAGAVHVVAGGPENYLALEPFDAREPLRRIRRLAVVKSVAVHRGQLLDVGRRRLALFGRPAQRRQLVMASALSEGSLGAVSGRLREGGWAAISSAVARERGLSLGERFRLPTPAGDKSFRVAGITTNYFWPPGAVVLGTRDYERLWGDRSASELMIELRSGVTPQQAKREVAAALGPRSGLRVLTADERGAEFGGTARQALTTLGQIGGLVLICAVLAVAAAMGVAVWQRRQRLAALKTMGFRRGQLLRLITMEAVVLLTVGGAIGAGLGLYAQAVASRWIELTSGSSVSYSPALGLAGATLAVLVVLATAAAALPGRLASGVPPRAAFSE